MIYLYLIYLFKLIYLYVSRSETAKHLKHDSFAFIFGVVFFISLLVSSIITYLFVQGTIISIPVDVQVTIIIIMQ